MAWINGWPVEKVYRFRKISARSKIISILSALTIWPLASAVSLIIRKFLDDKIGVLNSPGSASSSVYQNLLIIIGMVILAPVCEEILFRGFIQSAYESRSKKYGFVIAALIFGAYHILNGISEVIPASILGLCMGFLVYKTGSLASSMLFHATANIMPICWRSAYNQHAGIKPRMVMRCCCCRSFISVALLRSVKEEARSDENGKKPITAPKYLQQGYSLVLSAVYLVTIGVLEIMSR